MVGEELGPLDEDSIQRIVAMEGSLRNSNDRVFESQSSTDQLEGLFCECGYPDCRDRLSMSRNDFTHVRSNQQWFILKKGHDIGAAETVVETHEGFIIVEKPEA